MVFSLATLVALAVRHFVLRTLDRHSSRGHPHGVLVLEAIRGPSVLWCLAAGLAIAIYNAEPPATLGYWAQKSIGVFTIVSIGLVVASMAVQLIAAYGERRSLRIAGLSRTLVNLVIFGIVLLMVLSQFNVQITPILTALGVGGLAVALALQDTLANFFAGVHILVEEPIRVGDFIRLTKDEEGTVRDIGWRTTRIQTFSNTVIVIPNQKITSGILTNFNLLGPRVTTEIVLVAAHQADPDRIAAIAMEIAAATDGVLSTPGPSVWFDPGILPSHLQMKLIVHVANMMDKGPVQSSIRARIHQRFRSEGIPYPEVRPS